MAAKVHASVAHPMSATRKAERVWFGSALLMVLVVITRVVMHCLTSLHRVLCWINGSFTTRVHNIKCELYQQFGSDLSGNGWPLSSYWQCTGLLNYILWNVLTFRGNWNKINLYWKYDCCWWPKFWSVGVQLSVVTHDVASTTMLRPQCSRSHGPHTSL